MKLKLAKYGADQAEVVNQSISNQWQGLFDLRKAKPAPGEKPEKTDKQKAADSAAFQAEEERNIRYWDSVLEEPLGKLKLAEALLARYTVTEFDPDRLDKLEFLRGRVGDLIRESDPAKVVGDSGLCGMIRQLFGERGINRLKQRVLA
jgi:hypothetical protein